MRDCYKSGDDDHRETRQNAADRRDHCKDVIEYKTGLNICYYCSESDYSSYKDDVKEACGEEMQCEEEENDEKVDCEKMQERLDNADKCLKAMKEFAYRCFNDRESSVRQAKREKVEELSSHCKEILEYKKDHKLCNE